MFSYRSPGAGVRCGLRRLPAPGALNLSVHVWTYDFSGGRLAFLLELFI